MSAEEREGPHWLGPARDVLHAALRLAARAAGSGDGDGAYSLVACAARLARKVRGLGEVADFRLERALDEAEGEGDADAQLAALRRGLESLAGAPGPEEAPQEPLGAAQTLIGQAISIGAPAYNTGDIQGCYDTYSCTARAILATLDGLPETAAGRLRAALEECDGLDAPDEQAWAMRHAFDAVATMGAGEGVAPGQATALLAVAITLGAPAFDLGDHRGCYEVYACTARLLLHSPSTPGAARAALRTALEQASTEPSVTRQAWILRKAFDALIGSGAQEQG